MSRDVYHVGSTANGILISAGGLGAMIGGLGLGAFASDIRNRGRMAVVLLLVQGGLLVLMAANDWYMIGVLVMAGMGALGSAAVALITTLVQEHVPAELRGRVMGFFLLTFISFPSAGSFVLGLLADVSSIQWALFASALVLIAGCVFVSLRNPAVVATE
jgi:MFS family permease